MRTSRLLLPSLLSLSLLLAGCGDDGDSSSGSSGSSDQPAASADAGGADADDGVTEALESAAPTDTVEVPSADGATTIADYASGGSDYEPADPSELAQILAVVGTDADGYLTADAVVVRTTEADAALWCPSLARMGVTTYRFVPVLPDGTGLACE